MADSEEPQPNPIRRRKLLSCLCALGLGLPTVTRSDETDADAAASAPRPDDLLAFAFGQRAGQAIGATDLELGAEQVFAYPMDPVSRRMRDGSRLNQLVLVRLDAQAFTEHTQARSAAGVVAYSGVCTHTGCDITDWNAESQRFQCPCHESQFDPTDAARVVGGPAPWQLAALPLKLVDDLLVVAGEFEGRVGFQQPGLDPFGSGL